MAWYNLGEVKTPDMCQNLMYPHCIVSNLYSILPRINFQMVGKVLNYHYRFTFEFTQM